MNALGFYLARALRREAPLVALSVPESDLMAELAGRRVALVGNARALADGSAGAEIDAHDLVIRINRAPMPAVASHGRCTDWLALAVRLSAAERARIAPRRILWMSHKRKRLGWSAARSPGFYLHPLADFAALARELGAPPTTGAMLIALLARSEAAAINLYGFDFFGSLSLSGRRRADQVPHDFAAERAWVADLIVRDTRFALHPPAA